jgi:hypothetical protein
MAVGHRDCDLHARVVDQLAVLHRAAEDDRRLVEPVAGGHGVAEGLVHSGAPAAGGGSERIRPGQRRLNRQSVARG